ncbi:SET domain-containing protein [Gynurincola endophyticus]|uniref:SET domain-containing protein n=1 Tax=Gynurincola endophyticus TaxID=2479004 RepID=UPI000F8CBCFC|nr:SET domain-containing protein-lysine N-methyltransferase [Gynurincola endophyticus]
MEMIVPKLVYKVEIARSKIAGDGLYAAVPIPAKRKLGDMGGKIVSIRTARKIAKQQKSISIVEFEDDKALLADIPGNDLRFINHSCAPNTYMRLFRHRVEFYTLRAIKKGEELTCNYGETHHEGKLKCNCGASQCKGYL